MRTLCLNDIISGSINNQLTLNGTNPSFIDAKCILFLEYVAFSGSSLVVNDGAGVAQSGTLTGSPLDLTKAPLRLEGGVQLTGTVLMAKFFIIRTS
jgi:hypothetical protein